MKHIDRADYYMYIQNNPILPSIAFSILELVRGKSMKRRGANAAAAAAAVHFHFRVKRHRVENANKKSTSSDHLLMMYL